MPGSEADVTYAYDLLSRLTSAAQPSLSHSRTLPDTPAPPPILTSRRKA